MKRKEVALLLGGLTDLVFEGTYPKELADEMVVGGGGLYMYKERFERQIIMPNTQEAELKAVFLGPSCALKVMGVGKEDPSKSQAKNKNPNEGDNRYDTNDKNKKADDCRVSVGR